MLRTSKIPPSSGTGDGVASAFEGRLTVDLPTAAGILGIDAKTLRRHADLDSIGYFDLGHSTGRKRRRFSREDLTAFLEGRRRRDVPGQQQTRHMRADARAADRESFLEFVARKERESERAATAAKDRTRERASGTGAPERAR